MSFRCTSEEKKGLQEKKKHTSSQIWKTFNMHGFNTQKYTLNPEVNFNRAFLVCQQLKTPQITELPWLLNLCSHELKTYTVRTAGPSPGPEVWTVSLALPVHSFHKASATGKSPQSNVFLFKMRMWHIWREELFWMTLALVCDSAWAFENRKHWQTSKGSFGHRFPWLRLLCSVEANVSPRKGKVGILDFFFHIWNPSYRGRKDITQ